MSVQQHKKLGITVVGSGRMGTLRARLAVAHPIEGAMPGYRKDQLPLVAVGV